MSLYPNKDNLYSYIHEHIYIFIYYAYMDVYLTMYVYLSLYAMNEECQYGGHYLAVIGPGSYHTARSCVGRPPDLARRQHAPL